MICNQSRICSQLELSAADNSSRYMISIDVSFNPRLLKIVDCQLVLTEIELGETAIG